MGGGRALAQNVTNDERVGARNMTLRDPSAQESVSKALWKMGITHTTQHLTSDGLFCVDIALGSEQVQVFD